MQKRVPFCGIEGYLLLLLCNLLTIVRLKQHCLNELYFSTNNLFAAFVADISRYLDLLSRAVSTSVYTGFGIQLSRWTTPPSQHSVFSFHTGFLTRKIKTIREQLQLGLSTSCSRFRKKLPVISQKVAQKLLQKSKKLLLIIKVARKMLQKIKKRCFLSR